MADQEFDPNSAMEVGFAEMETRLRQMITDLLQPTIHRTTSLTNDQETLKALVSQHTKGLQDVQLGQFKALEQVSTITSFKEEMNRWDSQRRAHESSVSETLTAMGQKMDMYRYSLEQKESALHHLQRSVDRMAMELNRLQEEQSAARELFDNRLDEQSRRIAHAKTELDVRITGLELRHNALTDELWSEETGLAKVTGELKKTDLAVAKLEADMDEVQSGKAEQAHLDNLRTDIGKMVHESNALVSAMRQTVGNVVNDVKEHFRTASQTISAHNATFVGEVRQQYKEELANHAKLRDEVKGFMGKTGDDIADLDKRVADAAAKASALATEAREEVEELNRRRKRDKTSNDNELKALKKRLGGVFDNSDQVLRAIEHIYNVIQVMLESEFMQSSIEIQDAVDRKRIALMGVKDDETMLVRSHQTEPQRPRPECRARATSAPGGPKPAGGARGAKSVNPQEPVVRVDNRCLSCSGQAPLVLSAFKMACLQYAPSPVDHDGRPFDRGELLDQRQRLLKRARDALQGGGGAAGGASDALAGEAGEGEDAAGSQVLGAPTVRQDALADYASIEGRVQASQTSQGALGGLGGSRRLPNLGATTPSPRPMTVR